MEEIILSGSAIIQEGKLLLLYKFKDQKYELPGGKVKSGESLEEAAIRETREEINCDVKLIKYLVAIKFKKDDQKIISHKFLAQIIFGEPKANEIEHNQILWMPIQNYQNYSLQANVIEFCQRYLNQELDV